MDFIKELLEIVVKEWNYHLASDGDDLHFYDGALTYHVWKEDERFFYGTRERGEPPTREVNTSNPDFMANWVMLAFMHGVRWRRGFQDIAITPHSTLVCPGWSFQDVGESMWIPVRPDGTTADFRVRTWAPRFEGVSAMTWILDADPHELLTSYLHPQGTPLLTHLLEHPNTTSTMTP
ncbi:hypothetical protein [Schaalia hyovaginalis]|uniref:hypothetical protein n=1 Tax=Schaalia hyovaginalis TaxID=29316 RepID=UPI002A7485A5|nr:hypothetical protein [Schaalia hyovaginalis]MDY2669015.1 hypothetical protein [Schaalia hyovaginalis]